MPREILSRRDRRTGWRWSHDGEPAANPTGGSSRISDPQWPAPSSEPRSHVPSERRADDSALTFAVARTILRCPGWVCRRLAAHTLCLLPERYDSRAGGTTALRRAETYDYLHDSGTGAGGAMRVVPIGVIRKCGDLLGMGEDVAKVCLPTHGTTVAPKLRERLPPRSVGPSRGSIATRSSNSSSGAPAQPATSAAARDPDFPADLLPRSRPSAASNGPRPTTQRRSADSRGSAGCSVGRLRGDPRDCTGPGDRQCQDGDPGGREPRRRCHREQLWGSAGWLTHRRPPDGTSPATVSEHGRPPRGAIRPADVVEQSRRAGRGQKPEASRSGPRTPREVEHPR